MMSSSQLTDLHTHLKAASLIGDTVVLADIAEQLHAELIHIRRRHEDEDTAYLRLLAAARASTCAERAGHADPLIFVRHELDTHGQLPDAGQNPARVLADAATTQRLRTAFTSGGRAGRRHHPASTGGDAA